MLKKLSEEKVKELIETGISEFAEHGLENAAMSKIAASAGISVGVMYKYFADKDAFFLECVRFCVASMEEFVTELTNSPKKLIDYAEECIRKAVIYAREHADYLRLYHEITCSGNQKIIEELAPDIEGMSSKLYTDIVRRAKSDGAVRQDMDPGHFAWLFDNLMMMLQFSFCCPYYSERYRMYTGKDILQNDEEVAKQLLLFLESAFTFESSQIKHS